MHPTKIEWCDCTWNPVTGCFHGCDYCYARKNARRFGGKKKTKDGRLLIPFYAYFHEYPATLYEPFRSRFYPQLHCNRLNQPQEVKMPKKVFVCSMGDLFGKWVPDEWIEAVFDACEKAPQHTYFF